MEKDTPEEEQMGKGIGFARYKNSAAYCAIGVSLTVTEAAEVLLHHAYIVCDAGEIVDLEGACAARRWFHSGRKLDFIEQVLYERDGIVSRDWDTYPIITFDNIPKMHTYLIENPGKPYLGAARVQQATAAAISNALKDATGLSLRKMPFNPDAIMEAALEG